MIAAALFLSALVFIPGAGPLVDAYDLPKTALVGALAVMVLIDFYLRARDGERISFPLLGPIMILLALSALSYANAVNTHYFFYAFGAMLAGFSFFFYGVNSRLTPHASRLLLAPVVIVAAYALTPWLGITTTFGNQERGSALVALAAAIAASQVKSKKEKVKNTAALLLIAPLLLFLWQAEMRSAMVGLGIGFAAWLLQGKSKKAKVKIAAGLLLAGAVTAYARPDLVARFTPDGIRPALWEEAVRQSMEFQPFGIGLGQWRLYAQALVHDADFGAEYWRELHNDYVQLLVEAGPMALAAWGYLMWRILKVKSKKAKVKSGNALLVGLIAVLVNAFFLFPFQLPIEAAWFWLIAGIHYEEVQGFKGLRFKGEG